MAPKRKALTDGRGSPTASGEASVPQKHHARSDPLGRATHVTGTGTHVAESLNTTIGLEIELIVATIANSSHPQNDEGDFGRELVHDILSKPFEAACCMCATTFMFKLPLNTLHAEQDFDYASRESSDCQQLYKRWTVAKDDSVKLDDTASKILGKGPNAEWYAIELVSRILTVDPPLQLSERPKEQDHTHCPSYSEELRLVVKALKDAETPDMRILTNETCGFHIHIGNQNSGFPLPTVKNALSLYTAHERVIDQMHAASRIGGTDVLHQIPGFGLTEMVEGKIVGENSRMYNFAFSEFFIANAFRARRSAAGQTTSLQNTLQPYRSNDDDSIEADVKSFQPKDFVDVILSAPTLKALQTLFSEREHHQTIDLRNLDEHNLIPPDTPTNTKKMTIEFRQHAGTLNKQCLSSWIEFVVALVNFAHSTSTRKIRDICAAACKDPDQGLSTFLRDIDADPGTIRHYEDQTNPNSDAAALRYEAERSRSEMFGQDHPLHEFVMHLAEKRRDDESPDAVMGNIRDKMKYSGYGQFSEEYLVALPWQGTSEAFSPEELSRLEVGYEESEVATPPDIYEFDDAPIDSVADGHLRH